MAEDKTGGKKNKKRKREIRDLHSRLNIRRVIAYLVQLAIVIAVYDYFRNYFFLVVLILEAAAPFFSIAGVLVLRHSISVSLTALEQACEKDSTGFLKLAARNTSWILTFDIQVQLDSENLFYGKRGRQRISIPARARGTFEKNLPVRYSRLGMYRFSVPYITVRDFLGLVSLRKEVGSTAETTVFPRDGTSYEGSFSDMAKGMTESEETVKKGHDFSDVSDVREYIPGDRLNSIHWKLTAKKDVLMVKDRVSMSDQQMVILTVLSGTDETVDEILDLTWGVCRKFTEEQTYIRLLWWNETAWQFEERQIMNPENLRQAFSDLYYARIYREPGKTRQLMQSIHPELKAYVEIGFTAGEADAAVIEQA